MSDLTTYYQLNSRIAKEIPYWTQGAGSNLSCKLDAKEMIIKASGFRLDQVDEGVGSVRVDYQSLKSKLLAKDFENTRDAEIKYGQSITECKIADGKTTRASMEAGFHAVSPNKWVLHFHSLTAILMAHESRVNPAKFKTWKETQKSSLRILPLVKPGRELVAFFQKDICEFNILSNHGVVLSCDFDNVLDRWELIEEKFIQDFNYPDISGLGKNFLNLKSVQGPIKFYFPDMAIYFAKLEPYLESVGTENNYLLNTSVDKDLVEIWVATQLLYKVAPNLTELSKDLILEITQLPTEKLRQKYFK